MAQVSPRAVAEERFAGIRGVHEQLLKRGAGHGVKLIRVDGSEIKGRIVTVHDDSVDLATKEATNVTSVQLSDVAKVKGPGLSTGTKVGIGVGVGILVSAGIAALVIDHEVHKTL